MGVCIAALCDGGHACVVAADREVPPGSEVDSEVDKGRGHGKTRILELTETCVVLAAGDESAAAEVVARVRRMMEKTETSAVQGVAELFRETCLALREELAERLILQPRGLTLKEFRESGFHKIPFQRYKQLDGELFHFTLGTDFLVAGMDRRGGHIGWVHDQGRACRLRWVDQHGYHAIGAGFSHETVLLSLKNQHKDFSIAQTVYNVYCAKTGPGASCGGDHRLDIAVIGKRGTEFLSDPFLSWLGDVSRKNKGRSPSVGTLEKLFNGRHSRKPRAA